MLRSHKKIQIPVRGLFQFIEAAIHGAKVTYSGNGRVHGKVTIAFQTEGREKLSGIYGIEAADDVFGLGEDVRELDIPPASFPIRFTLYNSGSRSALLLLILSLFCLPMALFAYLLFQKARCRLSIDGVTKIVALRRFRRIPLRKDRLLLGFLIRAWDSSFQFKPHDKLRMNTTTLNPGRFRIATDEGPINLIIEPNRKSGSNPKDPSSKPKGSPPYLRLP
jgi:hypothetical protein